jgi:hypothetical protein
VESDARSESPERDAPAVQSPESAEVPQSFARALTVKSTPLLSVSP